MNSLVLTLILTAHLATIHGKPNGQQGLGLQCSLDGVTGIYMNPKKCDFDGAIQMEANGATPGRTCCTCEQDPTGREGTYCNNDDGILGTCTPAVNCTGDDNTQGSCLDDLLCCVEACQIEGTGDICDDGDGKYGICSCECGSDTKISDSGVCESGLQCCVPQAADGLCFDNTTGEPGVCSSTFGCTHGDANQGTCPDGTVCCPPALDPVVTCISDVFETGICFPSCTAGLQAVPGAHCSEGTCCTPTDDRFVVLPFTPGQTAAQMEQKCFEIGRAFPKFSRSDISPVLGTLLANNDGSPTYTFMTSLLYIGGQVVFPDLTPWGNLGRDTQGTQVYGFIIANIQNGYFDSRPEDFVYDSSFNMRILCEKY